MTGYPVTPKTTVVEEAVATLLQQFKTKPRMVGVLTSLVGGVQGIETALGDLFSKINLETGVGHQLDLIGKLIGVKRYGVSDTVYRVRLRVEILVKNSAGTLEQLLEIMRVATSLYPGTAFNIQQAGVATVVASLSGPVPVSLPIELFLFLDRARALGVQLFLNYSPDDAFTLATGLTEELDTTHGWGDDTNPATGGKLSGVA